VTVAVGADQWTVRNATDAPTGPQIVDALRGYGLDGLQIDTVTRFSASLDAGELRDTRQYAAERGFYLEGGLPRLNPLEPAPHLLEVGDGDLRRGVERHLHAVRELITGSATVRAFIAEPWDRAKASAEWTATWAEILSQSQRLLTDLLPVLRALDLRLAIENHGDATTAELVELAQSVDPERIRICLDTRNLPLTLEGPLEGVARAAPHTFATHLKDAIIVRNDDGGLTLHARVCGEGVLRVPEMVDILKRADAPISVVSIEDHDMLFPIPVHDPAFVGDLRAGGAVEEDVVDALVAESEQRIAGGQAPSIEELEAIPWEQQEPARAAQGAAFVRTLTEDWTLAV
jgi:sugar phosphate isomerase/epimerase